MLLYPAEDVYTINLDQLLPKNFSGYLSFSLTVTVDLHIPYFCTVNSVVHMVDFCSPCVGGFLSLV